MQCFGSTGDGRFDVVAGQVRIVAEQVVKAASATQTLQNERYRDAGALDPRLANEHIRIAVDPIAPVCRAAFLMVRHRVGPYLRINVLFPNKLSIRSTATIAVPLRTSSAGFS